VRTLLSADPDVYEAAGTQFVEPLLGESSLICVSGERHRTLRKLETPPFHAARMRTYGELILRVAEQYIARWPRGRSFPIHPTMKELMMDVILQGVFGLDHADKRQAFREAVPAMIEALEPSFLFFRRLRVRMAGFSPWARFQRKRERVAALFQEELRARRVDDQPREDILSLLMSARYDDRSAIPDDELLAQMVTLFVAGFEPTANSLAFALHHIHREPAVKQRLLEELSSLPPGPLDPETVVRLSRRGRVGDSTGLPHPAARRPQAPARAHAGRLRASRGAQRRNWDPERAPPARSLSGARALPARTVPRAQLSPVRVPPLRRRRPPLHRLLLRAVFDEAGARDRAANPPPPTREPRARPHGLREDDRRPGLGNRDAARRMRLP
jgi:hypothetical protein